MKILLRLEPVLGNTYRIASSPPTFFQEHERLADQLTAAGKLAEAGELRLEGAVLVADLFEESQEDIALDWEDPCTASALSLVYASATDHFIVGDYEVAAAMSELLIDHDPEDHLNASELLGFCYVALEEWELLDEITAILPADAISTLLLDYWAEYRQRKDGEHVRSRMREKCPELYKEWTAETHDDMQESNSEVRRLWLRTETLWVQFPDFIRELQ